MVFNDSNGNGVKGHSETTGLKAFIYLDLNKNGKYDSDEASHAIHSDARSGNYKLTGLPPGTYRVRQIVPNGYRQTLGNYTVVVSSGQLQNGKNFGDAATVGTSPGSISGSVLDDADGDGVWDAGENGRVGWRVFLDRNGDGLFEDTEPFVLTGSKGRFTFSGLAPGTYILRIVGHKRWKATTTMNFTVNLASGEDLAGKLFGQTRR